jgi:hypothetical protein
LDEPRSVIEALTGLAGTMAATGRYVEAARLLAAMDAQREASGFEPRPCENAVLKRWRGATCAALEQEGLERFTREGRTFSIDEALILARS